MLVLRNKTIYYNTWGTIIYSQRHDRHPHNSNLSGGADSDRQTMGCYGLDRTSFLVHAAKLLVLR